MLSSSIKVLDWSPLWIYEDNNDDVDDENYGDIHLVSGVVSSQRWQATLT